jgi:hypothetical protein
MPLWFAQVFPGGAFIVGLGWTRVKARGYIATGDERYLRALPALIRPPVELLPGSPGLSSGGLGLCTMRI